MKLIAIEEHFLTSDIREAWKKAADSNPDQELHLGEIEEMLDDLGEARIERMDESGVNVQVLSLTSPSLHNLGPESVRLAMQTNDLLADVVKKKPERYQGFACLPMSQPDKAPVELERAVKRLGMKGTMVCGRTVDKNLDHQVFWPLFEAAESLKAPIFIHPQIPQKAIRDIYYSGFDPMVNLAFSTFGLGWHYEAGIQFLRLVLAGVFDQFPHLQIILGHWGEVILFYTERLKALDRMAKLKSPLLDYMRQNLYITASGMFNASYMQQSIDVVGIDRIIFSTDYPYQYRPGGTARRFMEQAQLSETAKEKFAHGNWERLISGMNID